jgi:hypothetical protein
MATAASPMNLVNPAFGDMLLCSNVFLAQYDESGNFDRESCEQSCRSRYGVGPIPYMEEQGWGGGSGDLGGYYLYANCIDSCNRRFWREFDRKMKNLDKSR